MVMQARGYRFDFTRGIFVYSGTVSIKSNPQNATIEIDGQPAKASLSRINRFANVTGLIPGNYDVKVISDGFKPWSKKTEVHSGIASEFWNVLLIKNSYDRTAYNIPGTSQFFISPKNKSIAIAKPADFGTEIDIVDIGNKTTGQKFNFAEGSFSNEELKENIEWSPQENFLSIPLKFTRAKKPVLVKGRLTKPEEENYYQYMVANLDDGTSFKLNDFLDKETISHVRWDPKEKNFLFFLSDNSLYRTNLLEKGNVTLIAENISAYDLSGSQIYYVQLPNNLVFKTSLDGQTERIQLTSGFPLADKTIDKMIVYDDDRIAFLDQDKELVIFNYGEHADYFKKIGEAIEDVQFSNDGKKLLYWTANEISVYFLRDWNVQPNRAEDEINTITRYSENIRNVQWFKDYENVIFSLGDKIKIIELDSRDHRNCNEITNINLANSLITYNDSLEYLFFTDKNGDASELYSIVFPEPTNILGF